MKVLSKKHSRRSSGFTLVELVIVITIIAVLSGSGIYLIIGFIDDAKYQRVDSDLKALDLALKSYERNNYFKPPSQEQGLQALVERPSGEPQPERWRAYLEEPMKDPWGADYQYLIPPQKSTKKYDIFSLGEDGVESDDDIGNW
ncbi:MAG: type II secretion system major pseudopilin GspG [Verrucomicrobiales bacterium]|jgi:general secretion pathway protein G|nr:type II secretion system major pseudopilin GspG [Verrucomicrobiales bacterium]HQW30460.1 type II secretion system major pseudopilin GspG [Verrucomicrobiales bacterium]